MSDKHGPVQAAVLQMTSVGVALARKHHLQNSRLGSKCADNKEWDRGALTPEHTPGVSCAGHYVFQMRPLSHGRSCSVLEQATTAQPRDNWPIRQGHLQGKHKTQSDIIFPVQGGFLLAAVLLPCSLHTVCELHKLPAKQETLGSNSASSQK